MSSVTKKPMRLPPLKTLRVHNPNPKKDANPCLQAMSSVLSCWASVGYTASGCVTLEQQLRKCMDEPPAIPQGKNAINHHLNRMYPKIVGPRKLKK